MNENMKLSDFELDLNALNVAYRSAGEQLGATDSVADERVQDLLRIWWEALSADYRFLPNYEESVLHDAKSVMKHKQALEQLELAIKQQDSKSIIIWCEYPLSTLQQYVSKVGAAARDRASRMVGDNHEQDEASDIRNDYRMAALLQMRIEQVNLSHELRVAVRKAKDARAEAETAAENARTAAGIASGSNLTERFKQLSEDQLRTAFWFRCLTAAGVLVGIVGTYLLTFGHSGAEISAGEAIVRVSLLGAVLGLATYFGRQAAYHRDLGTWARTIKEQLLTFDGYVEPISDETLRGQMRAAFAARVFGSSPESKDEAGVTLSSSLVSELLAAIGKSGANTPK
ncbi:UNVERIFIED_ORG: hypothetical protein J3D58_002257 [Paenarthrobacter nicotinovorans]